MDAGVGNSVSTNLGTMFARVGAEQTFQLTNNVAVSGGAPEASTLAVWSILCAMGLLVGKRKLTG